MYIYATQITTHSYVHVWRTIKHIQHLYLYGSVTMFILGCDYGVCFLNTLEAIFVKNI